jgi:hypothetical protein
MKMMNKNLIFTLVLASLLGCNAQDEGAFYEKDNLKPTGDVFNDPGNNGGLPGAGENIGDEEEVSEEERQARDENPEVFEDERKEDKTEDAPSDPTVPVSPNADDDNGSGDDNGSEGSGSSDSGEGSQGSEGSGSSGPGEGSQDSDDGTKGSGGSGSTGDSGNEGPMPKEDEPVVEVNSCKDRKHCVAYIKGENIFEEFDFLAENPNANIMDALSCHEFFRSKYFNKVNCGMKEKINRMYIGHVDECEKEINEEFLMQNSLVMECKKEEVQCIEGKRLGIWIDEDDSGLIKSDKYLGSIMAYSGDMSAEKNYNWHSWSAHPINGPKPEGWTSKLFFYEGTDGLTLNMIYNVDGGGSKENVVKLNVTSSRNNYVDGVVLLDDPNSKKTDFVRISHDDKKEEKSYDIQLKYWKNTDGIILGPYNSNNFKIRVRPQNLGDSAKIAGFYSASGEMFSFLKQKEVDYDKELNSLLDIQNNNFNLEEGKAFVHRSANIYKKGQYKKSKGIRMASTKAKKNKKGINSHVISYFLKDKLVSKLKGDLAGNPIPKKFSLDFDMRFRRLTDLFKMELNVPFAKEINMRVEKNKDIIFSDALVASMKKTKYLHFKYSVDLEAKTVQLFMNGKLIKEYSCEGIGQVTFKNFGIRFSLIGDGVDGGMKGKSAIDIDNFTLSASSRKMADVPTPFIIKMQKTETCVKKLSTN